jgi:hypothetical protein
MVQTKNNEVGDNSNFGIKNKIIPVSELYDCINFMFIRQRVRLDIII